MSDLIKLLPEHVANQIAAGEVIQRPASVVKELLENAVDAGSSQIRLIIRDGGKTFVQVIDNGRGMSPIDARMCWERHATSKISQASDIYNIRTMGFRGEALASIASVAQVELKTRREEDSLGTLILIEGSVVKKQEPIAFNRGTSIGVRNLFYNIPARRNFLKSNPVETRHIIDEFMRVALANPEIALSMHHNDEEIFDLKSATLQQRIGDLFGTKTAGMLLAVEEQTSIINIQGFVGRPELAKKNRGEQFFFVNKRFIKDPYLNHAVANSYENLISKEQYPFYVLHFDINPALIDVNIHPTKTEIKFEDEKSVYQIIRAVTKKALGQHYHIPQFEPASEDNFLQLSARPVPPDEQRIGNYVPPVQSDSPYASHTFQKPPTSGDWKQLFDVIHTNETVSKTPFTEQDTKLLPQMRDETIQLSRNIMQLHNSLILSQVKSGVMLIDQQAAHERILFEKYLNALHSHPLASQQKLFPKAVVLNAADEAALKEMLPEIRALGFDINELGKNTFVVNGVPSELNHYSEQDLVENLLEQYKQQSGNIIDKKERVARSLAKKAGTKAGVKLGTDEMTSLIDELFACKTPDYAPDGKRCVITLTVEELFGLLGKNSR